VTYDSIKDAVNGLRIPALNRVEIFDVYRGEQVGKGKKSMALSFEFRSRDRTLTDAEVGNFFDRIKNVLIKKTGCAVREG
jgi:phenylalanyl-tRNA synthetase beta chain